MRVLCLFRAIRRGGNSDSRGELDPTMDCSPLPKSTLPIREGDGCTEDTVLEETSWGDGEIHTLQST